MPLNEEIKNVYTEGGTYNENAIEQCLKSNPDTLIFIGNCVDAPIKEKTLAFLKNTDVVVIQSKYHAFQSSILDNLDLENFLSEVSHLPFVKSTNVEKYTSLEDLLSPKPTVQGNIKHIRMNVYQDKPFDKLKP